MKEGFSGKDMHIIKDYYSSKQPDKDTLKSTVKHEGISKTYQDPETGKEERVNISPIDFFSISPDIGNEEILEMARKYLGTIDLETTEGKEALSETIRTSKEYLENYLHWPLPEGIRQMEKIESKEELLSLLRKTTTLKPRDSMTTSPYYCSLVLVAIAELEYKKQEMQNYNNETYFLLSRLENEEDLVFVRLLTKDWDEISLPAGEKNIKTAFRCRDKEHASVVTKMLRKPEIDATKIIQDGIGLEFKVDPKNQEDALMMLESLIETFAEKYQATGITFENKNFFDYDTEKQIAASFGALNKSPERSKDPIKILGDPEHNPTSSPEYASAQLKMTIKLPKAGDPSLSDIERMIEIQFVPKNSKYETGYTKYEVYKALRKLSVTTRLLGSFSEKYFNLICEEAAKEAKLTPEGIKEYFLHVNQSIRPIMKGESKAKRYASIDHLERWAKAGLLPKGITWNKWVDGRQEFFPKG